MVKFLAMQRLSASTGYLPIICEKLVPAPILEGGKHSIKTQMMVDTGNTLIQKVKCMEEGRRSFDS